MKNTYEAVSEFIIDQEIYDNPHKVEIVTYYDDTVTVSAYWPDEICEGDMYLELFFESNTIAEFTRVFGIRCIDDLEHITPDSLHNLYKQGKAVICCTIDNMNTYYSMQFRKQNNNILAKDDEEIERITTELLETPQQFMDYTLQHFLTK
jgi:hypothetical protein